VNIKIRRATAQDAHTIWRFIRQLADYQNHFAQIETTPASLREQMLSTNPPFQCLLAEDNEKPIGFALFHYNYSTWDGKPGIYIDDLFVLKQWRSNGVGKLLIQQLANIAIEQGCSRIELSVLDWNKPSIAAYQNWGGEQLTNWLSFRFDQESINNLANVNGKPPNMVCNQ
jgi:GNAT superfamily N-acetyltransferase